MWLLVAGHVNGDVDYYGPFPTADRAVKYAASSESISSLRWFTKPLVVPYTVVHEVTWRRAC